MNPKMLKKPFSFATRKVVLQDGILHVPPFLPSYEAEVALPKGLISVEFCSGNGHWIAERARETPGMTWVAVEKRFDRVRKIWAKRENFGLKNLFIVCGDGRIATKHFFPSSRFEEVVVNFPDPWPKDRHAKHRIIQPEFVDEVRRILVPGGKFRFVTDDLPCRDRFVEAVADRFGPIEMKEERGGEGESTFENFWRREGRAIHYVETRAL